MGIPLFPMRGSFKSGKRLLFGVLLIGIFVGGAWFVLGNNKNGNGREEIIIAKKTMKDDSTISLSLTNHTRYKLTLKRIADVNYKDPEKVHWWTYLERKERILESQLQWFEKDKVYSWMFTSGSNGKYTLWIGNGIRMIIHTTEFQVTIRKPV